MSSMLLVNSCTCSSNADDFTLGRARPSEQPTSRAFSSSTLDLQNFIVSPGRQSRGLNESRSRRKRNRPMYNGWISQAQWSSSPILARNFCRGSSAAANPDQPGANAGWTLGSGPNRGPVIVPNRWNTPVLALWLGKVTLLPTTLGERFEWLANSKSVCPSIITSHHTRNLSRLPHANCLTRKPEEAKCKTKTSTTTTATAH